MTVVKDIRALQRGLRVLEVLNQHNGSTLTEITRYTSLPKATTYRILENLIRMGYVMRDKADAKYRLCILVRRLSEGFDDTAWLTEIARPMIRELGREVVYPIAISTLYGTSMLARETTDRESALALDHYTSGTLLPMFSSASGKVYVSYCTDNEREILLDLCAKSEEPEHNFARDARFIDHLIQDVRDKGYALGLRQRTQAAQGKSSALAVPIMSRGSLLASLALRYIDSAMTPEEAVARYLGPLQQYATKIGDAVAQYEDLQDDPTDSVPEPA